MTADYWRDQLTSITTGQVRALAASGLLRDLVTGDGLDLHVKAALGLEPLTAPLSPPTPSTSSSTSSSFVGAVGDRTTPSFAGAAGDRNP